MSFVVGCETSSSCPRWLPGQFNDAWMETMPKAGNDWAYVYAKGYAENCR